ncbi:MAG: heavy metal translocating P-type ATPase [Ectothiorhodospiraceae bacterium]|jgi:Cu+-exporting ATPase
MASPRIRCYRIEGAHGAESTTLLEHAVAAVAGVVDTRVDETGRRLYIYGEFLEPDVLGAVAALGLRAQPEGGAWPSAGLKRWWRWRTTGLAAGALLCALPDIFPVDGSTGMGQGGIALGADVLAGMIALVCGAPAFGRAFAGARERRIGLELLAVLSASALWLGALLVALVPAWGPIQSSGSLVPFSLLILLSSMLYHEADRRTRGPERQAIPRLQALRPQRVTCVDGEHEVDVDVADLRVGDRVRVRVGDRVPADGVVVDRAALVDESLLSGVRRPVRKPVGTEVVGASLNRGGEFVLQVTHAAERSVLARLIATVRSAQRSKPRSVPLVDRVATAALPGIGFFALATLVLWTADSAGSSPGLGIVAALGVLGLGCPLALALAGAMPQSIGIARSAEYGAVIRRGGALWAIQSLTTIVLDKTGTITRGLPDVVAVEPVEDVVVRDLFLWAASLADGTATAVGQAVVRAARERDIEPARIRGREVFPDGSLRGRLGDREIVLATAETLAELEVSNSLYIRGAELQDEGSQALFVAVDGRLVGLLGLSDPLRDDAEKTVGRLRSLGLRVVMLTGADERTARAVAQDVGVPEVIAGVLPEEKAAHIRRLQRSGERVGMVGDGVNDAPALVQAHVGFAVAAGTEVALQSADVTLVGDSLNSLVDAVTVARAAAANARQNVIAAFLYNLLLVPVAAGVLYSPFGWLLDPALVGGVTLLATLTVLANASRLRFEELGLGETI